MTSLKISILMAVIVIAMTPVSNTVEAKDNLLLTGRIKPANVQELIAPWSRNWNHTVKWLRPEGETVEKGDLIVVFDPSDIDSRIEQDEARLRQAIDKAKEKTLDLEKKIIEAKHILTQVQLEGDKITAKARVPKAFRSNLDYDQLQFEKKKNNTLLQQAKVALSNAQKALIDEKEKTAITEQQITEQLNKLKAQKESLQLSANRKGTVLHANHPWNGTKISAGATVQTSMKIASIPDSGDERVQAWINEVDRHKVTEDQNVKLTLDAYPNSPFWGKIEKIGQQAENKKEWGEASYYDVDIAIVEAPQVPLVAGMSVRIETRYDRSDIRKVSQFQNNQEPNKQEETSVSRDTIATSGELTSTLTTNVGPPLVKNQWQFKITYLVPEGSQVEKGQNIIKFDTVALSRKLVEKKAELKTEKKNLETIILTNERTLKEFKLKLEEAKMEEEKAQRKWKLSNNVDASIETLQLEIDYKLAQNKTQRLHKTLKKNEDINRAKSAIANNKVFRLETEIKELETNIKKMTVTAPKSGIVVYKADHKGEKVSVGDSTWHGRQLISLPSLEKIAVKLEVYEAMAGQIAIGQKAEVRLDALPDRVFYGEVSQLGKVFRRKSRQQPNIIFDVTVLLEKTDTEVMRPGMTAKVKLFTQENTSFSNKIAKNIEARDSQ